MRWNDLAAGALIALATTSAGAQQRQAAPKLAYPDPAKSVDPALAVPDNAAPRASSNEARYDQVGYAGISRAPPATPAIGSVANPAAMTLVSATLPLGSFAEVTDIDSGHTILAEVTDRGPVTPGRLVGLSPGAAQALGLAGTNLAPVRVRSIMPSPVDQAALRAGRAAAPRMDAPPVLLTGLRGMLADVPRPAATVASSPRPAPRSTAIPPSSAAPGSAAVTPAARPSVRAAAGKYVVQVAALSNRAKARALAARLGGTAEPAGGLWRIRLGPFADAAAANHARDDVAKRGYGDARVLHQD